MEIRNIEYRTFLGIQDECNDIARCVVTDEAIPEKLRVHVEMLIRLGLENEYSRFKIEPWNGPLTIILEMRRYEEDGYSVVSISNGRGNSNEYYLFSDHEKGWLLFNS